MINRTLHTLLATGIILSALFSCAEKEQEISTETGGYTYEFVLDDGDTRAVLNDEGVFWETGDQVGLYAGSAASVAADVNASASPKTITYTSGSPLPAGTTVCSYYPYQEGNTNVSATTVSIAATQQGGSLSAMPMAGVPFQIQQGAGNQGVIRFLNLGSIIDFRVFSSKYAGERVRSIRLTATSGSHPVSGEATVDLTGIVPGDDASMALFWPSGASNPSSVTLSQSANVAATKEAAADAGHLYMVIAPGTYSGTITVTTNVATYTFPFTDKQFKRNGLKRFNMDLDNAEREAWYVKVTSASDIVDGGKYLIVYENTSKAFKPILNSNQNSFVEGSDNAFSVSIDTDNDRIRSTEAVDACQIELKANNSNYYMKSVALGYYFYPGNNITTAGTTASTACTFTYNNSGFTIKNGSYYFKYSTYNNRNYFKSSSSIDYVALYRLDEGQQKPQTLQFSASSFTYILDGQTPPVSNPEGTPTLSGAQTQVSYVSSNTSVATVNASTGAVTIQGVGTTTITATAEADDFFKEASASYTLEVKEEAIFSVENDQVAAYFDYVELHPYTPENFNTVSYVQQFASIKFTNTSERYDWPKPVPVSWATPVNVNNATVLLYTDADHNTQDLMANVTITSSTTADVYSLIPNQDYWYVVRSGNDQIAEGRFHTTGRRRMIKVGDSPSGMEYANNCRDFGGLITTSGRTVRYNRIFRGTHMDNTTATQKTYLKDYMGIGLDVDLRENTNHNPLNVTLSDQVYNSWTGNNGLTNTSKMKSTISDILQAVNSGTNVYVHCKVGADRTGYVCLLLQSLLGVRQDLCDIDYELTSFCLVLDGGNYRERNDKGSGNVTWYYYPKGVDMISGLSGGDYVNIYGDTFQAKAINYVVNTLGIDYSLVTAFQNAMLEPAQ